MATKKKYKIMEDVIALFRQHHQAIVALLDRLEGIARKCDETHPTMCGATTCACIGTSVTGWTR